MDQKVHSLKKSFIQNTFSKMKGSGKIVSLLTGDWNASYAVAAITIEDIKGAAEIHGRSADIIHVFSGQAKFILGGAVVDAKEVAENEFIANDINGGKIIEVFSGDIINIPPGTVHQIDATGTRVEFLIFKINNC